MVATARHLDAASRVRLSAGRRSLSREAQVLCFLAGANSIFYGDKLLTTANNDVSDDLELIEEAGCASNMPIPRLGGRPPHLMSRIVYVNGSFVPEADAKISVFDRAFLFAEGVYEVTAVLAANLSILKIISPGSTARLQREIALRSAMPSLRALHAELIALNKVDEGISISRSPAALPIATFLSRGRQPPWSPSPKAGR